MAEKIRVRIVLTGSEDSSTTTMRLTDEELALLKRVQHNINRTATAYAPIMNVGPVKDKK